jgi:hypothetical protein
MDQAVSAYDRTKADVGNVVEFGHVNLLVPDQRLATMFYVSGLGLTRDPFLMTGTDNMWVNVGTTQFHLPEGPPQVLTGVTGVVVPDLAATAERLARMARPLEGTRFSVTRKPDLIETTCPWGNRIRLHEAGPSWPGLALGIAYVEVFAPPGSAAGIARFYREVLLTPAVSEAGRARVPCGTSTELRFVETDAALPKWDGHHIQITLANFSGPHDWLLRHGLITEESDAHQYRFCDVVDVDSGAVLVTLEHEVRSMRHPLYARPLINRNPEQSNRRYAPGHEVLPWSLSVM